MRFIRLILAWRKRQCRGTRAAGQESEDGSHWSGRALPNMERQSHVVDETVEETRTGSPKLKDNTTERNGTELNCFLLSHAKQANPYCYIVGLFKWKSNQI